MPLLFYREGESLRDLDKYLGPNGESRFVEVRAPRDASVGEAVIPCLGSGWACTLLALTALMPIARPRRCTSPRSA